MSLNRFREPQFQGCLGTESEPLSGSRSTFLVIGQFLVPGTVGNQAVIDTELARGLMAEERARLQPDLAATPQLIEDNAKAIEALKAKAGA